MADHSTQLACPHCGSTLTFGMDIAAGTSVECLICMQTFEAAPMSAPKPAPIPVAPHATDVPTMSDSTTAQMPKVVAQPAPTRNASEGSPKSNGVPVATPAPAKSAPATGIPVGKPATSSVSAKAPVLTATKANPDAEPTPPIRKPVASPMGSKLALLAAALGLAFLLTGGLVFAIVKIAGSARPSPSNSGTLLANNGNTPNPADDGKAPPANNPNPEDPENPPQTQDQGSSNNVVSGEEDEQLRNKIREETKQLLKRKAVVESGEIDWQPVAFNEQQQQALGLTQQKINAAINKGVNFLKQSQQQNGTWHAGHGVGHAAIGGLTLLECGVPAKDPAVQRAAFYVRSNISHLSATYELSLAVLFLDRLGDKRDRPFIQGMAMRLIAGQYESGGWHYQCPLLTPNEMVQLYSFLHANKKPNLLDPLQGKAPNTNLVDPLRDPGRSEDAAQYFGQIANPQMPPKNFTPKGRGKGPAFGPGKGANPLAQKRAGQGDNSNTQFALLALWAARRHDVPSDQALLKAFDRFATSQNADFGWGYTPRSGTTNTMTSVGLLGMAMGHGVNPEVIRFNPKDPKDLLVKPALQDQRIQNGLQALARNIGQPSTQKNPSLPMQNLYFLWSVERVAMLYDLRTIGGKDWYGWGAQILVHNQSANGSWQNSHYPGANPSVNTCFALLFLKRSNLVQDLTNHLRLYSGIRDSESKNP
ncbi:MAG TPA: hypothetical protein VFE62_18710 [Gemmataceae bacterium]|nr:hypothetical protein [Gemmataceae bacterium]